MSIFAKGACGALKRHFWGVKIRKLLGFGPLQFDPPGQMLPVRRFTGDPRPWLEPVRCTRPFEEEGDILWQLDSISARRDGRACGPMELCVHCDGAGTYIRRCTAEDCKRVARGRSILVLGNDVAVACAIKCKGHGPDRRSCGLEGLPDVVIDRRVVNC